MFKGVVVMHNVYVRNPACKRLFTLFVVDKLVNKLCSSRAVGKLIYPKHLILYGEACTSLASGGNCQQHVNECLYLPGSVRQKAAMCSPEANLGKYFCFCASLPAIRIP